MMERLGGIKKARVKRPQSRSLKKNTAALGRGNENKAYQARAEVVKAWNEAAQYERERHQGQNSFQAFANNPPANRNPNSRPAPAKAQQSNTPEEKKAAITRVSHTYQRFLAAVLQLPPRRPTFVSVLSSLGASGLFLPPPLFPLYGRNFFLFHG